MMLEANNGFEICTNVKVDFTFILCNTVIYFCQTACFLCLLSHDCCNALRSSSSYHQSSVLWIPGYPLIWQSPNMHLVPDDDGSDPSKYAFVPASKTIAKMLVNSLVVKAENNLQ